MSQGQGCKGESDRARAAATQSICWESKGAQRPPRTATQSGQAAWTAHHLQQKMGGCVCALCFQGKGALSVTSPLGQKHSTFPPCRGQTAHVTYSSCLGSAWRFPRNRCSLRPWENRTWDQLQSWKGKATDALSCAWSHSLCATKSARPWPEKFLQKRAALKGTTQPVQQKGH